MYFWIVVGTLLAVWLVRLAVAKRALRSFCDDDCLTLAVKAPRDRRWRHGYARLTGDALEWRAEYKFRPGADRTFRRADIVLREHRPVIRGEAMLSDRCELVSVRHAGDEMQMAVVRDDLDRFLAWVR